MESDPSNIAFNIKSYFQNLARNIGPDETESTAGTMESDITKFPTFTAKNEMHEKERTVHFQDNQATLMHQSQVSKDLQATERGKRHKSQCKGKHVDQSPGSTGENYVSATKGMHTQNPTPDSQQENRRLVPESQGSIDLQKNMHAPQRTPILVHQSPVSTDPQATSTDVSELKQKLELYKATASGNWTAAKEIFYENPDSLDAPLNSSGVTVLHVAASSKNELFLRQLIELMARKKISLQAKTNLDRNALYYAAQAGNTEAAKLLVNSDQILSQQLDKDGESPLQVAALFGHEETVKYLFSVTRRQDPSLFTGDRGVTLLNALIMDNLYDVAMEVLGENPELAIETCRTSGYSALEILARKPHAFPSGGRLTFWELLLYHVWMKFLSDKGNSSPGKDIENQLPTLETDRKNFSLFGLFKKFHNEKLKQKQVLQLLKLLIDKAAKSKEADLILKESAFLAAKGGIHEFVAEVIKAYPHVIFLNDKDSRNIFDLAIIHRQERVFSLLYQLSSWKYFTMGFDQYSCSTLHLAAKLEPTIRMDKLPGAALQMQRELQWFKAVEELVQPWYKVSKSNERKAVVELVQPCYEESESNERKVPDELFFESHQQLVKDGGDWMKNTANSYSIVAALVVTVAFAAAFTVPGGNNGENGLPIFLKDASFMVFAISNALALFSATTALLMFLGILTSRCSQEDFFKALPMRLAIGQIALFFAIASMLVAFSASLNIVLSQRAEWIIIPIGLLACLPVSLFSFLQFPLLVEVVSATFGPSIFRKYSDEMLI